MLTMQALAGQQLTHSIPPTAAADHSGTGWTGGFERDGSEIYEYKSPDAGLIIRIAEIFDEEPNDDLPEDHPDYWAVDKRYSRWNAVCRFYTDANLFELGQVHYCDRKSLNPNDNMGVIYGDSRNTPDEALLHLLSCIPKEWLHASETWPGAVWQGWTNSYQSTAGRITAPIWI